MALERERMVKTGLGMEVGRDNEDVDGVCRKRNV